MRGSIVNFALTTNTITADEDPTLGEGEVRREPLFSFPVKVAKAVDEKSTKPKLDTAAPSGGEIETRRIDTVTGEVFDFSEIQHGKRTGDTFKAVPEDALTAIKEGQKAGKDLLIAEGAIAASDIPRRRIIGTFYLQPEKGATKAYRIAYEGMREEDRAIIAYYTTAQGTKRLAAIYANDSLGCLVMVTLAYAAAEKQPDEAVLAHQEVEVADAQVEMACQIVSGLEDGATILAEAADTAGAEMNDLLEKAMAGKEIVAPTTTKVESSASDDLTAALQASITANKRQSKAKKPTKATAKKRAKTTA